ncbi:MAG: TVP38/TMEM64 family protein [Bacillota bacterium]
MHTKTILSILAAIGVIALVYMVGPELSDMLSDREAFTEFLRGAGLWAPIGFIVLNAVQILFTPVPGATIGLVAGYYFGFGYGSLLNILGVLAGSVLAFLLARAFGKPLVDRFVGPKAANMLVKATSGKGLWGMALVYLLPFTPDDALCFVAGLSPIKIGRFAVLVTLCRAPGVLVANLTGSGYFTLTPLQWVVVGVASVTLLFIGWRKSDELEAWSMRMVERLTTGKARG